MKGSVKKGVVSMTLLSALFSCIVLIVSSLSPLANSGPHANQYGSSGLWISLITVLVCYILPVILYVGGVKGMTIVLAVIVSCALLTDLTLLCVAIVGALLTPMLAAIAVICGAALVINILWFVFTFRSRQTNKQGE